MKNRLILTITASLFLAGFTDAGELEVRVLDRKGEPVPDVVVYAPGANGPFTTESVAVMDQVNEAFSPHVLAVRKGAPVRFPNSDTVAHHVYSFSKPNAFTLPLYKGEEPDPVVFDSEGIVVLGCNIHDNMLGYILVVDSGSYAMTDQDGMATLAFDDADTAAEIRIWSPRIRDKDDITVRQVNNPDADSLTFELLKRLRPVHQQTSWDDY